MVHKQGTVAAGHTTLRKLPHDDYQFKACLGLSEILFQSIKNKTKLPDLPMLFSSNPLAAQKGDTQVTRPGGSTQNATTAISSKSLHFPKPGLPLPSVQPSLITRRESVCAEAIGDVWQVTVS